MYAMGDLKMGAPEAVSRIDVKQNTTMFERIREVYSDNDKVDDALYMHLASVKLNTPVDILWSDYHDDDSISSSPAAPCASSSPPQLAVWHPSTTMRLFPHQSNLVRHLYKLETQNMTWQRVHEAVFIGIGEMSGFGKTHAMISFCLTNDSTQLNCVTALVKLIPQWISALKDFNVPDDVWECVHSESSMNRLFTRLNTNTASSTSIPSPRIVLVSSTMIASFNGKLRALDRDNRRIVFNRLIVDEIDSLEPKFFNQLLLYAPRIDKKYYNFCYGMSNTMFQLDIEGNPLRNPRNRSYLSDDPIYKNQHSYYDSVRRSHVFWAYKKLVVHHPYSILRRYTNGIASCCLFQELRIPSPASLPLDRVIFPQTCLPESSKKNDVASIQVVIVTNDGKQKSD
ncbi:hypothetical protein GE061_016766 [Apolygus lucorum]|uniref:Uncharacterized protein n=1 Tax=Apolygus lucorum TaxID=248454 RepID=A0A8S9XH30_APOLU|nr:hypothetical protein GE061_016766 [Apolygus lucorum]